jgi:hypothetical protein
VSLRPPTREERQLALLWGVVVVCTLLLRPFWLAVAPFLPACPFRAITGIPCPTCGSTHAAIALMHGRLGAALGANPLAALAGIAFFAGGLVAPVWAALRWPVPDVPAPLPRWARAAIVAALLASWAYLIVKS